MIVKYKNVFNGEDLRRRVNSEPVLNGIARRLTGIMTMLTWEVFFAQTAEELDALLQSRKVPAESGISPSWEGGGSVGEENVSVRTRTHHNIVRAIQLSCYQTSARPKVRDKLERTAWPRQRSREKSSRNANGLEYCSTPAAEDIS